VNVSDVNVVHEPLVLVASSEVDALESDLWIKLPPGYHEFVTKLGEGELSGFVRVYSPRQIRDELPEWRRRIGRYWFWKESEELLPKERAIECVILADTLNGDELVYHQGRPESLFVMPRDTNTVTELGNDFLVAIDWMCSSGELTEPISEREFEPLDASSMQDGSAEAAPAIDPEGETLDDLIGICKAWGKRRDVRKLAKQDLKKYLKPGCKSQKIYEGLLWEGDGTHGDGYVIAYSIDDEATRLQLSTFHFHKTDECQGSGYVPNKVNQQKLKDMKQK